MERHCYQCLLCRRRLVWSYFQQVTIGDGMAWEWGQSTMISSIHNIFLLQRHNNLHWVSILMVANVFSASPSWKGPCMHIECVFWLVCWTWWYGRSKVMVFVKDSYLGLFQCMISGFCDFEVHVVWLLSEKLSGRHALWLTAFTWWTMWHMNYATTYIRFLLLAQMNPGGSN
jgi:hypothetical protein